MAEAVSDRTAPAPEAGAPPAVSVLIAVHDGMPYVEAAVRSMMDQTFRDTEILVVDDASADATPAVLARLAGEDPRIRVIRLDPNRRLPGALNAGLDAARAPLVARMDADDIAHPTRLAVQKAFMDAHPEVVLCGVSNRMIDPGGRLFGVEIRDLPAPVARWTARFTTPVLHPGTMYRRLGPDGRPWAYDTAFPVTEDYDLFARMLDAGEIVSLPDILIDRRDHPGSTGATRLARQMQDAEAIARRVQAAALDPARRADLEPFLAILYRRAPVTLAAALRAFGIFRRMIAADAPAMGPHAAAFRRHATGYLVHALTRPGPGPMRRRRVMALMALAAPDLLRHELAARRARARLLAARRAARAAAAT
jgi:glycosyltransferase involved in cell wall biosynthesis